ncbi:MAG: B-4DMT family transporter [Mycobacteriaceae bacterium]
MTNWLPRGLAFAAGMVLLRLVQGTLINLNPTRAGIISTLLLVLFGIAAFAWGLLDGRADAHESPDPDRRRDLAMRWLLAGLVAGVLGGVVVWLISLVYRNVYAEGLVPEVTAFAAFTALLVFLPATAGVALGRWQVDRSRVDEPRRRAEDGSDVFDAVRTGPVPAASGAGAAATVDYPEEHPSQVALAEREESEGATEQIARQIEDETERINAEIDDITDDRK